MPTEGDNPFELNPFIELVMQSNSNKMDIIDFETQQIQGYDKLTEKELQDDCIEIDGEFYLIDENHSGFLFLTDECAKQFNVY